MIDDLSEARELGGEAPYEYTLFFETNEVVLDSQLWRCG